LATPAPLVLAPSAARLTSGVGSAVDLGAYKAATVTVEVTAVSGGSPTLLVALETSPDNAEWRAVGDLDAFAGEGLHVETFLALDRYLRGLWTVSGTVTFSAVAEPQNVYATPAQFRHLGLPAQALTGISDGQIASALANASRLVDDYLAQAYTLPLVVWANASLTRAVCVIAAYDLINVIGFNPDGPDKIYVERYRDLKTWLQAVADGKLPLQGVVDATPDVPEGGVYAVSRPKRGW
jgi:phage gp36-like protein